jgi:lipopolysaccharide transport system permease protein
MINDIAIVAKRWRLVHLLGIATLRSRYARSRFGQMWLSISMLVQIILTGVLWAVMWRMPIDEYLPYVGVGHIFYLFVAQTISESTGVFIADSRLYLNDRMPFLTSIFAHVYRSFIVFLHNVPTVIGLILWSVHASPQLDWLFPLAFAMALLLLIAASYVLACICTRFRDMTQIVALMMQLLFLLSPVMWKTEFIPVQYRDYVFINPFAAALELLRNPLIGLPINGFAWLSLVCWTLVAVTCAYIINRRFDRRIIFWV